MVLLDTSLPTRPHRAPPSLLSAVGRHLLGAPDANAAEVLDQLVAQGGDLRALLDQLAIDMAQGNASAAQARLAAVLTPVAQLDATHERLRHAQREAQRALAAFQSTDLDGSQVMDAAHLRQLHTTASAVAAACDELAVCTQAWAALIDAHTGL